MYPDVQCGSITVLFNCIRLSIPAKLFSVNQEVLRRGNEGVGRGGGGGVMKRLTKLDMPLLMNA